LFVFLQKLKIFDAILVLSQRDFLGLMLLRVGVDGRFGLAAMPNFRLSEGLRI
jgi:hypothetical protein